MSRKLCVMWIVTALLACGTTFAAEIGLTSVLYPEGKKVDVPIAGTQRAPAAEMGAVVQHRSGQSSIQVRYKNLPPAVLFGGDFVSYVVWTVTPDGTVENVGGIANDGTSKGEATYSTGKRDFAMMITAEPIASVRSPGDLVVFFSGTPAMKGVKPTGFTFGGLSTREGLVTRENESIAGMTYKPDKKNPLILIQAEKAIELLKRFDAKKHDRATYDKAMAAMAEAREKKGEKRQQASKQTVVLAGQALSKTSRMIEAEKASAREAEETAKRVALRGKASGLETELGSTTAELEQVEAKLSRTNSELTSAHATIRKMESQSARLARQQAGLAAQLTGAMGMMASGAKTDRGYVVSLSGTAFASGQAKLTTDAKYVLAKLSGMLLAMPGTRLSVEGHTDSTGGEELNRNLSKARAEAVKTFLTEMGVKGSSMKAEGFGPDRPVAPNDTNEGRAKNRRVEIVISEG